MGFSEIDKLRKMFYCEMLRQDVSQVQCIDNYVWASMLVKYRDRPCKDCPYGQKRRADLAGVKVKVKTPKKPKKPKAPIHTCKHTGCGKHAYNQKDIQTLFGYKTYRKGRKVAKTMPQSWCRKCRHAK